MSIERFGIEEDEFWSAPDRTLPELADRLDEEGFDGVVIDAPAHVDLDARQTLPLLVLRAGSYRQVWAVGVESAVLVTMDLDRNEVVTSGLADPEAEPPMRPRDPNAAPEGSTTSFEPIDLRERLELEWTPKTLLSTVLLRDKASNRVRTVLGPSPGAYRDEAVEDFIAKSRAEERPTRVDPPPGEDGALPSYEPQPGSPDVPASIGIALAMARVVTNHPGSQSLVRGAFRLPVARHEVVRGHDLTVGKERRRPTAVVAVTLVTTGSELPGPGYARLLVPCFEPLVEVDGRRIAVGHFALDLRERAIPSVAQTSFVYAFSGEVMSGPVAHALVDPSFVRRAR